MPLLCSDVDYATAELIGNKLILHMAQAYQLIQGSKPIETPAVKPLDQKQILLSLLPDEFESKTLVAEAASQGISRATALRWNDEWQTVGLILKIKYGVYKKNCMIQLRHLILSGATVSTVSSVSCKFVQRLLSGISYRFRLCFWRRFSIPTSPPSIESLVIR